MPAGLNTWETRFAELLDGDANNTVTWWHRNEPRLPSSVNVLMPDGRVMILYLDGVRWMTVGYDDKAKKPILVREFRLADAAGF